MEHAVSTTPMRPARNKNNNASNEEQSVDWESLQCYAELRSNSLIDEYV